MIEKIIALFNSSSKNKIEFKPEIKVMLNKGFPVWIDSIYKIREMIMVKISTEKDAINKPLDQLNEEQLKSLNTRLFSLFCKKQTS
jgi:hypothetical protein